jgi:serine/threonine-protein kinase
MFAVTELAVGVDFAGCRVEEMIGRGGMGIIYRGLDLRLERPVAIKLIATEYSTDPAVRRRFEREARLMAAIDHPNVIPVYGAGEQDGHLYLVMRYVPGTDLHVLLRRRGRLPPVLAARIAGEVGKALDAAHACGLVHRDIKPANVLLAGEHIYLTDFGITRAIDSETVTDAGERVGTVDFMSPEHLRGERTDPRSDVYSLGCLLHTCLTGTPPFHRETVPATILAHITDDPPAASRIAQVPRQFDSVIRRALAKRPADRYQSAGELGRAAVAAASGRSIGGRSATGRRSASPRLGRAGTRGAVAAEGLASADGQRSTGEDAPTRAVLGARVMGQASAQAHGGESAAPRTRYRSRLRVRALAFVLGLVTIAAATGVALSASNSTPSGPLTAAEIATVTHAFKNAYGARNSRALGVLLAPDVKRISPSAEQVGRAAVLSEYVRQFKANAILSYTLQRVVITPGWAGRAAADYTVPLASGGSLTGHVVFGLERFDGQPLIELITTQQTN